MAPILLPFMSYTFVSSTSSLEMSAWLGCAVAVAIEGYSIGFVKQPTHHLARACLVPNGNVQEGTEFRPYCLARRTRLHPRDFMIVRRNRDVLCNATGTNQTRVALATSSTAANL